MDEPDESLPTFDSIDAEVRHLLGLFDVPAFARRGRELDHALARLDARIDRQRAGMLEMVCLRLRQWAASATGPDDWAPPFAAPIAQLWPLAGADLPDWAARPASASHRRAIARDLASSLERFNRRWTRFVAELNVGLINQSIEHYNRYYILEKECVLGSARLAARHFAPRATLTPEALLARYPVLPVPEIVPR